MTLNLEPLLKEYYSTDAIRRFLKKGPKNDGEEKDRISRRDTLDWIRKKGIPIDSKLTIESLLGAFDRGNVPANPSKIKMQPGEGLFLPGKPN